MRKLMWFAIGFTLSCAVGVYLALDMPLLILAVLGLTVGMTCCFLKKKTVCVIGVILLGFSAGSVWVWSHNHFYLLAARTCDGETVTAQIQATDYSYETDYGSAFDGSVVLEGKKFKVRAYLKNVVALTPGDTVTASFRFRLTTRGGKEAATYHSADGIFLLAYSQGSEKVSCAEEMPAKYIPAKLRHDILNMLDRLFPQDTRGFAKALLLGDSSGLTYEDDTAFQVSGIRHIIAVSGLHVSILFSLLYMLAGKHRVFTALFGIPVLLLFAAAAGFTPSVTRACIMQMLMILALLFDKEYDPPTALSFSVLVMMMANPMAITSVSLQLSAGCMVGIFLFSGRIGEFLLRLMNAPKGKSLKARFVRWFAGSVSVTVSAMVVTTPLCAYYFDMVSLVGILTNLLTLWIVSFVFYGIMLACVLGWVFLPAGSMIAACISWPIRYILAVARLLASFPLAAVYTCSVYIVLWLVVCYVLLLVFFMCRKKHPCVLASLAVACLVIAVGAGYIAPRMDDLRVTVLDVGQGQCILLQSHGANYMVDCGGDRSEEAAHTAAAWLLSQGITKLDGIILTHYDTDHAGGVDPLLSRVGTDKLYLPDIPCDSDVKQNLYIEHKDIIQWIDDLTVLSEDWGSLTMIPGPDRSDDNESGLSILFQAEECDILITGDRSATGERALLESLNLPKLELLVVGHHGAATSTCIDLLSITMPTEAVISVGKDNNYGQPDNSVLVRLELFGCRVSRTDLDGTIIYRR